MSGKIKIGVVYTLKALFPGKLIAFQFHQRSLHFLKVKKQTANLESL